MVPMTVNLPMPFPCGSGLLALAGVSEVYHQSQLHCLRVLNQLLMVLPLDASQKGGLEVCRTERFSGLGHLSGGRV